MQSYAGFCVLFCYLRYIQRLQITFYSSNPFLQKFMGTNGNIYKHLSTYLALHIKRVTLVYFNHFKGNLALKQYFSEHILT